MSNTDENMEKLKELITVGIEHLERNPENRESFRQYVSAFVYPMLRDVLKNLLYKIENRHRLEEPESRKKVSVIHYTSIATLVSMLQNASVDRRSASLRLYDSAHFNDPDEGNFFDRNLNLVKGHKLLKARNAPHAYIASFIRPDAERAERNPVNDDLVFWRTYGKDGEGCSLTLSVPSCRLRKVLYGTDKVKCTDLLLKSVLDLLYDSLSPLISIPEQPIDVQELTGIVVGHLEKIRYLYKDEAYQYEKECRFVFPESDTDKEQICFEYGEQSNTPIRIRHYYEDQALKIKNILGTGSLITLGPRVPYPNNVRYYLETLLRKAGLLGPEIKISQIRYRKS